GATPRDAPRPSTAWSVAAAALAREPLRDGHDHVGVLALAVHRDRPRALARGRDDPRVGALGGGGGGVDAHRVGGARQRDGLGARGALEVKGEVALAAGAQRGVGAGAGVVEADGDDQLLRAVVHGELAGALVALGREFDLHRGQVLVGRGRAGLLLGVVLRRDGGGAAGHVHAGHARGVVVLRLGRAVAGRGVGAGVGGGRVGGGGRHLHASRVAAVVRVGLHAVAGGLHEA